MPMFTVEVVVKHQLEFATPFLLSAINQMKEAIMAAIDDLTREVSENRSVMESAGALLNNIKEKLDAAIAAGDMSQVQALSDQLSNNTDELAKAVAANTPAEGT